MNLTILAAILAVACTSSGAPVPEPPAPVALGSALDRIPSDARALVLVDSRLHALIAPDLDAYVRAAAARRGFAIALLPVIGLDDRAPPEVREEIRGWRAARPALEGTLFVGNVKLPSFFMPRGDIPSTRLWPRFYEDLDMPAARRMEPGSARANGQPVPEHDFDELDQGPSPGPELWAAFLPVGLRKDEENGYPGWARQLTPFFRKAAAFYGGTVSYDRGLYLVSNDLGLLARSRPAWDAVGPEGIEFYSINEKGPGAWKDDPAGYLRADLAKHGSLDVFLGYAGKLPWMDEGWQSARVFLSHMESSRRRIVWWNVHSNPQFSLVTHEQARGMTNGGLIALLNGCSVGGFRQPGSRSSVDTGTAPEDNVLCCLVYGRSAFLAALGSPHDRVDDEHATPLLEHLYSGGYLGMAHLFRLRAQDRDSPNPGVLRGRQEMLIGDPFLDAR